eukprot:ctg_392.g241
MGQRSGRVVVRQGSPPATPIAARLAARLAPHLGDRQGPRPAAPGDVRLDPHRRVGARIRTRQTAGMAIHIRHRGHRAGLRLFGGGERRALHRLYQAAHAAFHHAGRLLSAPLRRCRLTGIPSRRAELCDEHGRLLGGHLPAEHQGPSQRQPVAGRRRPHALQADARAGGGDGRRRLADVPPLPPPLRTSVRGGLQTSQQADADGRVHDDGQREPAVLPRRTRYGAGAAARALYATAVARPPHRPHERAGRPQHLQLDHPHVRPISALLHRYFVNRDTDTKAW